jgi:short-subunit dehydrogenase
VDTRRLDLTGPDVETAAADILAAHEYGLVIYNAGAAHGVGLFLDQPLARATNLVRLNCTSPVVFAHLALTGMRQRGRGGLIMVSSMSAMAGSGYVAAYSAAKAFEINLAEALNWELAPHGVDVMCAVATLTDTPAMRRSGLQLDADPNYVAMDPQAVAAEALSNLGGRAVWFAAGEQVAEAMRSSPRAALTDSMSRTSARLWGLEV